MSPHPVVLVPVSGVGHSPDSSSHRLPSGGQSTGMRLPWGQTHPNAELASGCLLEWGPVWKPCLLRPRQIAWRSLFSPLLTAELELLSDKAGFPGEMGDGD